MLEAHFKEKIEEKFGKKILRSGDIPALSMAIYEATHAHLGDSTLRRLFGLVKDSTVPRRSTLDVLAKYVGYPDFNLLSRDLEADKEISDFSPLDELDFKVLKPGASVEVRYEPGRVLILEFNGEGWFKVRESVKSKLRAGDMIRLSFLAVGYELVARKVVRDGIDLGPYTAAKQGGVISIRR